MNTPDTDVKDFEEERLIQTNPITPDTRPVSATKATYEEAREAGESLLKLANGDTPDTEMESVEMMATNLWAIIYEGLIKDGVKFPKNFDGIGAAYGGYARIIEALEKERTSRDTYWKERVRKEVEGMRKNENNLGFELKDKWKAEAHNQALDTLLDNLK